MSVGTGGDRLACGRRPDEVLAQVADGRGAERDAHQRQCPHCQAALAEYDRLWAPVRELAAEPVTAPDSILDAALHRIRAAARHPDYGVLDAPDGRTRIAARVVVVTARETAQAVPGVRMALSKHLGRSDDSTPDSGAGGVTAGVAGASTAIEITLAADYGLDLRHLGEQVSAAVAARIRALTGLEPVRVTVIIDDVLD